MLKSNLPINANILELAKSFQPFWSKKKNREFVAFGAFSAVTALGYRDMSEYLEDQRIKRQSEEETTWK